MSSSPIFIHSLFRAGSTYLFNVFRRSPNGYFAYQEPLHEIAILARDEPERLLLDHGDEKVSLLRHPRIDAAYYKELHEVWPAWQDRLTEAAVYENYFAPDGADIGIDYWRVLAAVAKGRPVFQECRTASRIAAIRQHLGGYHIYLWRNPWDQWWSYKVAGYFDAANQLIINAASPPAPVIALLADLGLPRFGHADVGGAFSFYLARPLTSEQSYLVFYLLWCLALRHGQANADLMLNVDRLSESQQYRSDVLAQLSRSGIAGLDFFDCAMPQSRYSADEQSLFAALETRVHGWLKLGGWPDEALVQVSALREQFEPVVRAAPIAAAEPADLLEQLARARGIARRFETAMARLAGGAVEEAAGDAARDHSSEQRARAAEERLRRAAVRVAQAVENARQAATRTEQAERAARVAGGTARQLEVQFGEAQGRIQSMTAAAAERELRLEKAEAGWREQQQRTEELAGRADYWRAQAAALQADRQALRASWSWRITAPLRWVWGAMLRAAAVGSRGAGQVLHLLLEVLRSPIAAMMRVVLRDPQLSYRINQRLLRFPALQRHLVDIARRHAILGDAQAGAVVHAAPVATEHPCHDALAASRFAGGMPARAALTGTDGDIDELMLRIEDEVARWRAGEGA
jgi:hypothetical protein